MTALEYGSYGKPEDWEGLRKVKPKEVAFAETVFEGKVASRVPILQFVLRSSARLTSSPRLDSLLLFRLRVKALTLSFLSLFIFTSPSPSQTTPPPLTSRRTYLGFAMHLDNLFSLIAPPLPPATTYDPHRKHFSPWYYVDKTFPPTFLSWGDQDTLVRPRQSIVFRDKLEGLGVECGWAIAKGAHHGYAEKVSTYLLPRTSEGEKGREEEKVDASTDLISPLPRSRSPGLRREQAWSHLVGGGDHSWTRVRRQQARWEARSSPGQAGGRRCRRESSDEQRIRRGRGHRDEGRSLVRDGIFRIRYRFFLVSLLVRRSRGS